MMDEQRIKENMYRVVALTCQSLTAEELNALLLSALLGTDPRQIVGYDKVRTLYEGSDGRAMHSETKSAFLSYGESRGLL